MQNNNEEIGIARNNPVVGIIFLVWFIGSVVVMALAAGGYLSVFMLLVGAGQFFLGIIGVIGVSLIKKIRQHKSYCFFPTGLVMLMLLSVGLIAAGCLQAGGKIEYLLSELPEIIAGRPVENSGIYYGILFLGLFLIASFVLFLENVIWRSLRKKHCTVAVTGTCTELKSMWNRAASHPNERIVTAPVFQYEFEGGVYEVCDEIYTSGNIVKAGDRVLLHINPEEPEEFYARSTGIFHRNLMIAGVVLTGLALAAIVLLRNLL